MKSATNTVDYVRPTMEINGVSYVLDGHGRPYARLSELRAGMMVQFDECFGREIEPGGKREVKLWTTDDDGNPVEELYVDSNGLDGKAGGAVPLSLRGCGEAYYANGDPDHLVGVYLLRN
jgi:hypothetical protein